MKHQKHLAVLLMILSWVAFTLFANNTQARSGCCSSHQGVRADGCGCNDGTPLSATCAPYYTCSRVSTPDSVPAPTPAPTTPTPAPAPAPEPKIETKDETKTETISFNKKVVDDSTLETGKTKIKVIGINGEKIITYKVTYKDGIEQSREKTSEKVTRESVDEITAKGTKPVVQDAGAVGSVVALAVLASPFVLIFWLIKRKMNKKGR